MTGRQKPQHDDAGATVWYLTICKGCGLVWISDDIDGQDCPVGTPDAQGYYHVVFAFELYESDENQPIEDLVSRNLPDEWGRFAVALRDADTYWKTLVRDMPKHVSKT